MEVVGEDHDHVDCEGHSDIVWRKAFVALLRMRMADGASAYPPYDFCNFIGLVRQSVVLASRLGGFTASERLRDIGSPKGEEGYGIVRIVFGLIVCSLFVHVYHPSPHRC